MFALNWIGVVLLITDFGLIMLKIVIFFQVIVALESLLNLHQQ